MATRRLHGSLITVLVGVGLFGMAQAMVGQPPPAWAQCPRETPPPDKPSVMHHAVYTSAEDFNKGTLVRLVHGPNGHLRLDDRAVAYPYIWVPASKRGTIVKIDTTTGIILGEYWSAPDGRPRNPSRTTVDRTGGVWAGNRGAEDRNEDGSVVHIGLLENGQCRDRNGNGVIDTSAGLGDTRPWTSDKAPPADECVVDYVPTSGLKTRHVSVDPRNYDVWVGGYPGDRDQFDQIDGDTATIKSTFRPDCGGYGGLIDPNGVLWSTAPFQGKVLRHDIDTGKSECIELAKPYSLARDLAGRIWVTHYEANTVTALDPNGILLANAPVGGKYPRGVAVTADGHVWVANSESNTVTRLAPGTPLMPTVTHTIAVGKMPIGLSVDAQGKVWVTDRDSDDVRRIDPGTNAVDLVVHLGAGAGPYGYSDMTGSTLTTPPGSGTWTVVDDSGKVNTAWGFVEWHAQEPGTSGTVVFASSSHDGVAWSSLEQVRVKPLASPNDRFLKQGEDLTVPDGRYLKLIVGFRRSTTGESPLLFDLTVVTEPRCFCPGVPKDVRRKAVCYPNDFLGWLRPLNEGKPAGPDNPLRTCLGLRHPSLSYNPVWNPAIWRTGCR